MAKNPNKNPSRISTTEFTQEQLESMGSELRKAIEEVAVEEKKLADEKKKAAVERRKELRAIRDAEKSLIKQKVNETKAVENERKKELKSQRDAEKLANRQVVERRKDLKKTQDVDYKTNIENLNKKISQNRGSAGGSLENITNKIKLGYYKATGVASRSTGGALVGGGLGALAGAGIGGGIGALFGGVGALPGAILGAKFAGAMGGVYGGIKGGLSNNETLRKIGSTAGGLVGGAVGGAGRVAGTAAKGVGLVAGEGIMRGLGIENFVTAAAIGEALFPGGKKKGNKKDANSSSGGEGSISEVADSLLKINEKVLETVEKSNTYLEEIVGLLDENKRLQIEKDREEAAKRRGGSAGGLLGKGGVGLAGGPGGGGEGEGEGGGGWLENIAAGLGLGGAYSTVKNVAKRGWNIVKTGGKFLGRNALKVGALGAGALGFKKIQEALGNKAAKMETKTAATVAEGAAEGLAETAGKTEVKTAEKAAEDLAGTATKAETKVAETAGKTESKAAEKILAKGGEEAAEAGAKTVGKGGIKAIVAKVIGPKVAKVVAKGIPFVGALAGLGFGIQRVLGGDLLGAGAEIGGGVASIFPGAGTAVSVATDAGLLARDVYEQAYGVLPEKDPLAGERMSEITSEVMDYLKSAVGVTKGGINDGGETQLQSSQSLTKSSDMTGAKTDLQKGIVEQKSAFGSTTAGTLLTEKGATSGAFTGTRSVTEEQKGLASGIGPAGATTGTTRKLTDFMGERISGGLFGADTYVVHKDGNKIEMAKGDYMAVQDLVKEGKIADAEKMIDKIKRDQDAENERRLRGEETTYDAMGNITSVGAPPPDVNTVPSTSGMEMAARSNQQAATAATQQPIVVPVPTGGGGSAAREPGPAPSPSRTSGAVATAPQQSHIDRALYGDLYGAGVP